MQSFVAVGLQKKVQDYDRISGLSRRKPQPISENKGKQG